MNYLEIATKTKDLIPVEEYREVMSQEECEYCHFSFYGFLNVYESVTHFVPKNRIIIDFGCYLAFQSYMFADYRKYIGVDVVNMKRFTPENAEHYVCTIQEFIKNHPELANEDVFAICSYVPDNKAREMVKNTFKDCLVFYPVSGDVRVNLDFQNIKEKS